MSKSELKRDFLALLLLFVLPLLFFGPVVFGGKTVLPADNIYQYQPWQSYAAEKGGETPHNALLSDLVLENYEWKLLIREALEAKEPPLWNPYMFAGPPFLAEGQHSALFPLSIVYYIFPLWVAYGIYTWLALALADMAIASGLGAEISFLPPGPEYIPLFSEDQGRYVVTCKPENTERILATADGAGVPAMRIGKVGGSSLTLEDVANIPLKVLKAAYERWLPAYMSEEL